MNRRTLRRLGDDSVDDYYFVEKNSKGGWCVFKTQGESGLGEKEMIAEFQDEMSASIHAAVSQADVHQTSRDISLGDGSRVRAWPVERPGPGVGVRVVQADGTNDTSRSSTQEPPQGFPVTGRFSAQHGSRRVKWCVRRG